MTASFRSPLNSSTKLFKPNIRPSPFIGLSFDAFGKNPFIEKPIPPTRNAAPKARNIVTAKIGATEKKPLIDRVPKNGGINEESVTTLASKINESCKIDKIPRPISSPSRYITIATAIVSNATDKS